MHGGTPPATGYGEAAEHWRAVVSRRGDDDAELSRRLLAALDVLGRPPGRERS
ncbi:hypothetical protein [Planomonospora algeriensis]